MKNTSKTAKKMFLWPPPAGAVLYDGSQNETRRPLFKNRKVIPYLLHGARETGLPRPGVLCVGCLSWVRSIMQVRRCVGENDRTGSEKSTQKSGFECIFDTKRDPQISQKIWHPESVGRVSTHRKCGYFCKCPPQGSISTMLLRV
jgi:hypothetical protein